MGTEITKAISQGILVPDELLSNDSLKDKGTGGTDSSYSQSGSFPGVPVPSQDTYMALEASNTQSQDGHLEVLTLRAGHPGYEKAGFGFRDVDAGDGTDEYKGKDSYITITGWDPISWTNVAPSQDCPPSVVRLKSGKLLMTGPTDSGTDVMKVYTYTPSTSTWAKVTSLPASPLVTHMQPACLVALPSGRVLALIVANGGTQVDVYRTDDEGQNWALHSASALDIDMWRNSGTVSNLRMDAAYNNGQILLIVWGATSAPINTMTQYASDSLGGSFTRVDSDFYLSTGSDHQVFQPSCTEVLGGGFVIGCFDWSASVARCYRVRVIGSAFQAASDVDFVDLDATDAFNATDGFSVWTDEDGIIYALAQRKYPTANVINLDLHRSLDGGVSWETFKNSVLAHANITEYLKDFDVASTGGRAWVISRADATTATYTPHSVFGVALGGFSSHTAPTLTLDAGDHTTFADRLQFGWGDLAAHNAVVGRAFVPITDPANIGWTAAGPGTGGLVAGGTYQVSTAANTLYYTRSEAGGEAKLFGEVAVQVDSGGDKTLNYITAAFTLSDAIAGVYDHTVRLRFDTTGFNLYDEATGGIILTKMIPMTSMRHIRIALESPQAHVNTGRVQCWVATDAQVLEWEYLGGSTTVNSGGATARTDMMTWGHQANTTAVSQWSAPTGFGFGIDTWSERSEGVYAATWSNPDDLHPANFSTHPYLIKDGVKVKAITGPTKIGDSWDIEASYTYPISAIDSNLNPSPREPWRSTTDAATVDIVWDLESLYSNAYLDNGTIGLALLNINFKTAAFEGWNGAAWQTIASINTAEGFASLKYARKGRRLRPDTAQITKGNRYFWYEAHVGDTVDLGAGEDNRYHHVAHNTEGAWRGSGVTTKVPTITLADDSLDGGEPATGTMDIWRKNVLVVVNSYVHAYDQLRLRIVAQDTADGYFQIGTLVFGSFAIFGRNYSRGWSTRRSPDVEIIETPGRRTGSRILGPRRREYELSYTESSVDTTNVELDDPDPNYVTGEEGGAAIATPYDTIRVIEGVLKRVEHRKPIVLCRYIPQSTSGGATTHLLLDHRWWMLCRASNALNTTNVLGTEGHTETEQLDTVTFVEEV